MDVKCIPGAGCLAWPWGAGEKLNRLITDIATSLTIQQNASEMVSENGKGFEIIYQRAMKGIEDF